MALPGPRLPKDRADAVPSSETQLESDFLSHGLKLHFFPVANAGVTPQAAAALARRQFHL